MAHSHPPYSIHGPQTTGQPHVHSPQVHPSAGPGTPDHAPGLHDPQLQHYNLQADPQYYQYGTGEYGYPPSETASPVVPADGVRNWFDFSNSYYLKGFLIGVGATLLLTNSNVQKAMVRGTVKVWSLFQGGVEEVKEQFRDIKAEMSQEK